MPDSATKSVYELASYRQHGVQKVMQADSFARLVIRKERRWHQSAVLWHLIGKKEAVLQVALVGFRRRRGRSIFMPNSAYATQRSIVSELLVASNAYYRVQTR